MKKIIFYTLPLLLVSFSSVVLAKSIVSCDCNPNESKYIEKLEAGICRCSLDSPNTPLTGDTGGYSLNKLVSLTGGTGHFEVKCTYQGGDYPSVLVASGSSRGPGIVMNKGEGVGCNSAPLAQGNKKHSFSCTNWSLLNERNAKVSLIKCQTDTGYW